MFAVQNPDMFYLLRKAHILQLFVGVAALLCCGVALFLKPLDISAFNTDLPCTAALFQLLSQHPLGGQFFALALLLLQVLLLFRYVRVSGFLDEENILSVMFFCILLLAMGIFLPLTPAWITNVAVLAVLNLSNHTDTSNSKTILLLAGIVLGSATLFDPSAVLLLLYFLFFILFNQIDKFKDLLATLCGCFIPYLYLFAHHFFSGTLTGYLNSFTRIQFFFPLFTKPHFTLYSFIAIALFLLLTIYVIIRLKVLYGNKIIILRRRYLFLCVLLCFNVAMLLTTNIAFPLSLTYILIPVTVLCISFIPTRGFAISSEILLMLLTASLIVMARF